MPTWGQILNELKSTKAPQGSGWDFDSVRRKYLAELHDYTKRAVIVYYTSFLESRPVAPPDIQIGLQDIPGFMEAVSNVDEKQLDLIIHSPGGSAEAAESIVTYLRKRFDHIRIFVPVAAMSAATMVTLSADEIVMGQHSQLGPIDPQFTIQTPEGPRSAPAKAILNQFELAKTECKEAANLPPQLLVESLKPRTHLPPFLLSQPLSFLGIGGPIESKSAHFWHGASASASPLAKRSMPMCPFPELGDSGYPLRQTI